MHRLLRSFGVLSFLITKTLCSPDTGKPQEGKEKIKLSKLAPIWMGKAKTGGETRGKFTAQRVGQGRDSANLLKAAGDVPRGKPALPAQMSEPERHAFRHPELLRFYEEVMLPERNGFGYEPVLLRLAEEYLDILDRLGDCPSVVDSRGTEYDNEFKQHDATSGKSFWDVLKGVTLLQHSTRAARIVAQSAVLPGMIPGLIVAALGHDIGKIPAFRNDPRYAVGSHPAVGMLVAKQETCFRELPDSVRKDIEHAVINHHNKKGVNPVPRFTELIQEADRQARSEELMEAASLDVRHRIESSEMFSQQKQCDPGGEDAGFEEKKNKSSLEPGDYDLEWLDWNDLQPLLKPCVNRMENGMVRAISMHDGTKRFIVYAQVNLLREKADLCAKALISKIDRRLEQIQDPGDMEALALKAKRALIVGFIVGELDRDSQKEKSLALVNKLRSGGLVLEDLVAEGFYGAFFSVHYENGHVYGKYYAVPLRGEAFGTMEEIENRKKDLDPKIGESRKGREQERERSEGIMNVLEYLNPQHYVTSERYVHMWQGLIATLLLGFWARFLAAACIFLAFYFMVRRQRYQAGVWFIVLASILIYGGTVLKFFSIL